METDTITDLVIRAAYQVQKELGTGFNEKIYENAMMIALKDLGLKAEQQSPISVYFREQIIGEFYSDILVMDTVILELKAVKSLLPEHQAQLYNYLKCTKTQTGLLVNFAKKGLEIKRMYFAEN